MSVALPGVNEMITCTGLLGYACANADEASASPATTPAILLRQPIVHLPLFGLQSHSGCLRLLQQQRGEILLAPAAPDHLLHQVARHRGERQRHLEAPARVEA